MIHIADATEADLPAILRITNDAILNTVALWTLAPVTLDMRREWLAARHAGGFPVLVAHRDNNVAGFASYGPFRPFEGFVHSVEHSVYVDPAAQGAGIGKTLLAALIAHATSAGKHVMIGGIEANNAASIGLHTAAGFTETARMPQVGRKFDRWLDLVFMQKILA